MYGRKIKLNYKAGNSVRIVNEWLSTRVRTILTVVGAASEMAGTSDVARQVKTLGKVSKVNAVPPVSE